MGLLDELKKLTKPYDGEDYLEEDLADPVRVPGRTPDNRGYAAYAEPPRPAENPQGPVRRPYVFSRPQQPQPQQYAPQGGYAQQGYPQQNPYAQQQAYAQSSYAQQPNYPPRGYQPQPQPQQPQRGFGGAAPQAKLLLVRPDRFEVAADIADRISEKNAIVLNLESTDKDTTRRLLDFLSGVTYALGGNVKKVSGSTYIITPAGMDFMGDGLEEMETKENYF